MQSHEHAVVGGVVSAALALTADVSPIAAAGLVAWGIALSVFVDLDHFLLARYYAGHWGHLRWCLRHPLGAFTEQESIFDDPHVGAITRARVRSHAAIGAVLTASLWFVSATVASFTAAVLAVHVGCDLLRDRELV